MAVLLLALVVKAVTPCRLTALLQRVQVEAGVVGGARAGEAGGGREGGGEVAGDKEGRVEVTEMVSQSGAGALATTSSSLCCARRTWIPRWVMSHLKWGSLVHGETGDT
jgi:hypothetical protein